jgi:uncharacterized membrane protein YvbJ
MSDKKITPKDLEAKLTEFHGDITGKLQDKKQTMIAIAGGIGVVLLLIFFLLGRRSGKKKTTFVEIRRV